MPTSYPRTRVTTPIQEKTGVHRNYVNGSPGGYDIVSTIASSTSTCDDFVTPDYRKIVRAGGIINNPCSIVVEKSIVLGSGTYKGTRASNGNVYEVYGDGSLTSWLATSTGFSAPALLQPDFQALEQGAKQKCLALIDSSPYEFAEDVGELGTTVAYFNQNLLRIVKLVKGMRKAALKAALRNGKKVLSHPEALASVWLEYRFAIMPLVRSCESLKEALQDQVHRPKRRNARGILKDSSEGSTGNYTATGGFGLPVNFRVVDHVSCDVAAHCLYEVDNPVEDFFYKYGLRLQDIPETAWNLMPLSFMVDRIVNLSGFFRGITNLTNPSIKKLAGSYRYKYSYERTISAQSIDAGSWGLINLNPDTNYTYSFTYSRSVWDPTFVDTIPTLDFKGLYDSVTKTADLVAIITQFLR